MRLRLVRAWLMEQLEIVRRLTGIYTVALLAVNLSFTMYAFLEWRDIHPYVAIPFLTVCIGLLVWLTARLIVVKWEFYKSEKIAQMKYNQFAVYAVQPWENMLLRTLYLPLMRAVADDDMDELRESIEKIEEWVDRGVIPRDQFPPDLRKYYVSKSESMN